jgi:hypothetical protein
VCVPDRGAHGDPDEHCHCDADFDGNANANSYGYANGHCDRDRDRNPDSDRDCHGHSDAYGHVNPSVMVNASPPAGPKFADLMGQPPPAPAPTTGAPQPGSGGTLSNDGAMEAILTNPVHQARVQAEMSKQRLKKLAAQIREAQSVL